MSRLTRDAPPGAPTTPACRHALRGAGLVCGSLCLLALPLLLAALALLGVETAAAEHLLRIMTVVGLLVFWLDVCTAWRGHRHPGPGLIALAAGGVVLAAAWHGLPRPAGWLGIVGLGVVWAWDQRIVGDRCRPRGQGGTGSPGSRGC